MRLDMARPLQLPHLQLRFLQLLADALGLVVELFPQLLAVSLLRLEGAPKHLALVLVLFDLLLERLHARHDRSRVLLRCSKPLLCLLGCCLALLPPPLRRRELPRELNSLGGQRLLSILEHEELVLVLCPRFLHLLLRLLVLPLEEILGLLLLLERLLQLNHSPGIFLVLSSQLIHVSLHRLDLVRLGFQRLSHRVRLQLGLLLGLSVLVLLRHSFLDLPLSLIELVVPLLLPLS
mmetsp:Transcript_32058/g.102116  ORF Transcript_32058/g.102116 Transcript_32058/m.102116 type:complete len:235 (-) Transcript_32058:487-1191(-)